MEKTWRDFAKRTPTKYPGVYERQSDNKNHNGRADICYHITYKVDGKKIWEKVGWASDGYSAKLANQVRAERLRSIRHGGELPKQKKKAPFFKVIADKYLSWAKENKARQGIEDKRLYDNHLSRRFDSKRLNEISSFDLERMKSELSKEGLAPATVKHCLVLVRQIFNKALLWGMYSGQNPIKGVKMPTLQNERQRFLSHDEADTLLTAVYDISPQVHDMALIGLHCGLRAGEIFNLRGQDLDFDHEIINIADPKNKIGRQAYMTEAVKAALEKRKPEKSDELVFKDRHGRQTKEISLTFRRVADPLFNVGITDPRQRICFHSLRHTFASWLAVQGETLQTIGELIGHKDLKMTVRYSHLIPVHKRRATLQLEKAFEQKRNGRIVELTKAESKE